MSQFTDLMFHQQDNKLEIALADGSVGFVFGKDLYAKAAISAISLQESGLLLTFEDGHSLTLSEGELLKKL